MMENVTKIRRCTGIMKDTFQKMNKILMHINKTTLVLLDVYPSIWKLGNFVINEIKKKTWFSQDEVLPINVENVMERSLNI